MKKVMITLCIMITVAAASMAQVRIGPFLGYGENLGLWGLGLHTEFLIDENMSISPVFMQYFPEELTNEPRRTAWEVNANLNYYIFYGDVGTFYGLAGLNYTRIRLRDRNAINDDEVDSDGNLGLNMGIGTMFKIDRIIPFAEGKYTLGGYSQFSIFVGVKFQLGDDPILYDY